MHVPFVNENGLWYYDSPEYLAEYGQESKGNLLMVAGADILLDILAQGRDRVVVDVNLEPVKGTGVITCIKQTIDDPDRVAGATYLANGSKFFDFNFWLCPVTLYVLGEYPEVMYFKQIK